MKLISALFNIIVEKKSFFKSLSGLQLALDLKTNLKIKSARYSRYLVNLNPKPTPSRKDYDLRQNLYLLL